jgi:RHS repeat-associated protein
LKIFLAACFSFRKYVHMNVPPTSVPRSFVPNCLTSAACALVLAGVILDAPGASLPVDTLPPLPGFQPSDVSPTVNTEASTMITTGSGYDAWTGSVHRVVTDLAVPSTASAHGLKVVRTYSSSNGIGWSMSWQWQIHFRPWSSDGSYMVNFPDGRAERFARPRDSQTGETAFRSSAGTNERLYSSDLNNYLGTADLWLEDGSVVHFDRITEYSDATQTLTDYFTPRSFTDPYGRVTTLINTQYGIEYNDYHLTKVIDPTGRYLTYNYDPDEPGLLTSIVASTGESVSYDGNDVIYGDGTSAHYTYTTSTYVDPVIPNQIDSAIVLATADDVRAEGPMQSIKYLYRANAKIKGQLLEEQHSSGIRVSLFSPTNGVNSDSATNTETRGDGPSRTFFIQKPATNNVPLLRTKSDFEGVNESFSYDANNYVAQFTDRNAGVTSYNNETILGRPLTVTHPGGIYPDGTSFPSNSEIFTYSWGGIASTFNPYFVASRKDQNDKYTYYDRDLSNRLTQIRYPDGGTETFEYNTLGLVTKHKRRNGYYEFADYETSGRMIVLWNPTTSSTHPVSPWPNTALSYYNVPHVWAGRVQTVTDPLGNRTTYQYDLAFDPITGKQTTTPCSGRGLITKISYLDDTHGGLFPLGTSKSFVYDKFGNKLQETDELTHTTTYSYDNYNRLASVALPGLPTTTYVYTATNGSSAYSHTTDAWTLRTSPAGVKTACTYDPNLRKATQTEASGVAGIAATTRYDYDASGNLTKVTDPRGTSLGDPNHTTTTLYDLRNRKTRVTTAPAPAAQITDWKYDGAGNVTSIKRADGTIEYKEYDSMYRLTKHTVPKTASPLVNIVTQFEYFPAGTLKKVTDGKGQVTSFDYTGYDLRKTMTYPNSSTQTWTYDDANNVLQWKNPGGMFQTFTYDERNRKTSMEWLDANGAEVTWATGKDASSFTYDKAGRLSIADNNSTTLTRTYDDANRLSSEAQAPKDSGINPHTVYYTYRADGKVTDVNIDHSQSYDFVFGYDAMARLETIKYIVDTSTDYQYYYDLASNVTKRFNWNESGANVVYIYDNLNRVMERDINVPTSQIPRGWFSREHYGYDAMNRLISVLRDEDAKSDTFSYYQDGEMSAAHYGNSTRNVTYNLDLAGNRSSVVDGGTTSYVANNLNEYTTVGSVNPEYIAGHAMSAFGAQSYYYIAGTLLARSTVASNDLYLYYDALGRCMKRKLNGVSSYRVFQGEHWIAEYTSSNVNIGTAIYGNDVDELIARGYNGVPYWYFPDRNGNISVVLNTAGGVLESYRYDAFGAPSFFNATGGTITQSAIGNPFLFTGREWDHAFGLYEYRARGYDPDLGRFLSEDPKGFDAGDYNLYRYCDNDPLDLTDPTGTTLVAMGNHITIAFRLSSVVKG